MMTRFEQPGKFYQPQPGEGRAPFMPMRNRADSWLCERMRREGFGPLATRQLRIT